MEAGGALSLQLRASGWSRHGGNERGRRSLPGAFHAEQLRLPRNNGFAGSRIAWRIGTGGLRVPCSQRNPGAVDLEGSQQFSLSESAKLKKKAEAIVPSLNGRSIFLVGMMGSGKTTVGKVLAKALEYSFLDSDKLVEEALGGIPVAQIFKEYGEEFFRDHESKALHGLSSKPHLVVATGGGAVIRPINWEYMKKGITIWIDVPLEALARRIAAAGTASRPLLDQESGDAYTKAMTRLSALSQERSKAYANADARVSLAHIARKRSKKDVNTIYPSSVAGEALLKIHNFLIASNTAGEDTLLNES